MDGRTVTRTGNSREINSPTVNSNSPTINSPTVNNCLERNEERRNWDEERCNLKLERFSQLSGWSNRLGTIGGTKNDSPNW